MKKASFLSLAPYLVVFTLLTFFSLHLPFFWDTIQLGSRQALYFYDTNFHSLILPKDIDSGHFPLFGLYISIIWKLLGKNIPVSHIAMLPVLLGLCYQYWKLARQFIKPGYIHFAMLLLIADPVLLSQATMVSPDILLLFIFLAGVNFLLENKKWPYAIALCFLSLVSMRGMMTVAGLFAFEIALIRLKKEKLSPGFILKYLPAALLSSIWLLYHYRHTGWAGYYPGSPWAACFVPASPVQVLKNIGILAWRLLDFGRVFVWVFGIVCFMLAIKIKKNRRPGRFVLLALLIVIIAVYTPSFIFYRGLNAHRYLLPAMVMVSFCTIYYMEAVNLGKLKNIIFGIALIGLFSGNFWVYPVGVAEGWDATLAHLPYFSLRKQMINYININHIKPETIGTAFPNISGTTFTDLDSSIGSFKHFDLAKDKYIFQSNIFNDFKKPQVDSLNRFWKLEQEYKSGGIYVRLYSR